MAENPYPIPRQLRMSEILDGDGGDTYGPFDFEIFDPEDVLVCAQAVDELRFTETAGVTVTKVNGNSVLNPLDFFTITFPSNVPATTRYVVLSSRVAARDAGVISGTRINPDALEKEFSKIATQQQELRRDVGRAIMVEFGQDGLVLDAGLQDGDTLMKQGRRIVKGPNAGEIASAEGFAEEAKMWAEVAQTGILPPGSVTDEKVALPANPTDLIDGNKVKYTDGIDLFATPLVKRQRNWMLITDTDQITGNGTSNDQAGVENAVEKACQNNRRLLVPDDIDIRLTEPVANFGKRPFRLIGGGVEIHQNNDYTVGEVNDRGPGSWFFFDHSGKGFEFNGRDSAGNIVGNSHIVLKGIGSYRTQPAPAVGWAPAAHDFDFDFTQCTADIDDLTMWNPTKGIDWKRGRAGQLNIGLIRGQPLGVGIRITNAYDVVRIADVHFWRYWSMDSRVAAYILNSGHAIESRRNDNPIFGNIFTYGYKRALYVGWFAGNGGDEPAGTTYHASINNLCSDYGESALVAGLESVGFTANIAHMYHEQSTLVTSSSPGVALLGTQASVHFGTLVSNNTAGQALIASGANNKALVSRLQPGIYNRSAGGFPAVQADGAGAVVRVNETIDNGSGGGAPLFSETNGGIVTGLSRCGIATVPNGASGIAVTHGLGVIPRSITFDAYGAGAQNLGSFIPRASAKTQTTFTIDLGVAVSADRQVSWQASI